jgi:plastocyanin
VRLFVAGLMIAGAAFAAAPAVARAPKPRTVTLADNYYLPAALTVKPDTRITWRWGDDAFDVHDVKLKSAPKGVKKFHSEPGTAGYTFKRVLRKPGRYRFVCTLHTEMTMTIRVKRP